MDPTIVRCFLLFSGVFIPFLWRGRGGLYLGAGLLAFNYRYQGIHGIVHTTLRLILLKKKLLGIINLDFYLGSKISEREDTGPEPIAIGPCAC